MRKKLLFSLLALLFLLNNNVHAQKLLFEGPYHYTGQIIDLNTKQISSSGVFENVYIYVYDTKLVVRRDTGTSIYDLQGVYPDYRQYGKADESGFYAVDATTHNLGYIFSFEFLGQTDTSLWQMAPGTATIPNKPNLPAQAPICKQCHGAGVYIINGHEKICGRCGGLGRDWNS